jgi:hypothetical protein
LGKLQAEFLLPNANDADDAATCACWSLIELKQELVYLWNYWALMMPCWWKIAKVVHEQWITFQLGCSKTHSSPYPLPTSTAWFQPNKNCIESA